LWGWIGYDQPIASFGYYFDGNSDAVRRSTALNAEDAVIAIGKEHAKRFKIAADTTSLDGGEHTLTFVICFANGHIETLSTWNISIKEEEINTDVNINVMAANLDPMMQPMFKNNTHIVNETVMFIDYGDTKSLLYNADEIVSVKSYDGKITYKKGVDWELVNGDIKILPGSSMPCITSAVYYGGPSSGMQDICYTYRNGVLTSTYWGEGDRMTKWQVNVEYRHSDTWTGFEQECKIGYYADLINKLNNGEDVTVFYYGDSITVGANSSWNVGIAPYQYNYAMLVTHALADLFEYTVEYVDASSLNSMIKPVPTTNYVGGTKGTITYINTAVGGWTSLDGVNNFDKHVKPYIQQYGCDLFVAAFGGNDGGWYGETTASYVSTIVDNVLKLTPDTSVLMVATMVPNPGAYASASGGAWCGTHTTQETQLISAAANYRSKGVECAVAQMTSMSLSIYDLKDFCDYTGNNVNHPNDFFGRVYAQTLLQTLIGYENMK